MQPPAHHIVWVPVDRNMIDIGEGDPLRIESPPDRLIRKPAVMLYPRETFFFGGGHDPAPMHKHCRGFRHRGKTQDIHINYSR